MPWASSRRNILSASLSPLFKVESQAEGGKASLFAEFSDSVGACRPLGPPPRGGRASGVQIPPTLLWTHGEAWHQLLPSWSLSFLTCIVGASPSEINECKGWRAWHGGRAPSAAWEEEDPAAAKGSPFKALQAGLGPPHDCEADRDPGSSGNLGQSLHLSLRLLNPGATVTWHFSLTL